MVTFLLSWRCCVRQTGQPLLSRKKKNERAHLLRLPNDPQRSCVPAITVLNPSHLGSLLLFQAFPRINTIASHAVLWSKQPIDEPVLGVSNLFLLVLFIRRKWGSVKPVGHRSGPAREKESLLRIFEQWKRLCLIRFHYPSGLQRLISLVGDAHFVMAHLRRWTTICPPNWVAGPNGRIACQSASAIIRERGICILTNWSCEESSQRRPSIVSQGILRVFPPDGLSLLMGRKSWNSSTASRERQMRRPSTTSLAAIS